MTKVAAGRRAPLLPLLPVLLVLLLPLLLWISIPLLLLLLLLLVLPVLALLVQMVLARAQVLVVLPLHRPAGKRPSASRAQRPQTLTSGCSAPPRS